MSPTRSHACSTTVTFVLMLSLAVGCGDEGTRPAGPFGGSGGSVGSGGNAANGGSGGFSGMGGTGAVTGTGGVLGTGGVAGAGGHGGSTRACVTNALCQTCPANTCNDDSDCSPPEFLPGLVCVPTGCTSDGEPLKECQPARYISCDDSGSCPSSHLECKSVGGPYRCVPKTSGCTQYFEDYDCPLGFSCEDGACVDRRVPYDSITDCPKNHVLFTLANATTSRFCVSVFRSCNRDSDCSFLGSGCADVDGDGRKECTGDLDGAACVNRGVPSQVETTSCESASAPVCETVTATIAVCGQYGLCNPGDCADGFACVGLWQDGRKECVEIGVGNDVCSKVTECAPNEVCAAPRNGGSPRCQAGKEAL